MLLPYFIVVLGTSTGVIISALVPPDGIDCRHVAQLSILVLWLASAELDLLFNRLFPLINDRERLFCCTYVKDFITTGATMGCVIATQVGLFNRCVCYTQWGRTGLALPEMPDVATVLRARLSEVYPAVTFTSIGLELVVIPLAIWLWYGDAMRVSFALAPTITPNSLHQGYGVLSLHFELLLGGKLSENLNYSRVV